MKKLSRFWIVGVDRSIWRFSLVFWCWWKLWNIPAPFEVCWERQKTILPKIFGR